jgi:quercetin 2,3-dioxygenase
MISLRPSHERFHTDIGWLNSRHSFSFGEHYDPAHVGFRSLRVINEDIVGPGKGFPRHPHRDMEIISVVLDGALEHRDSTGTGSTIRRDDVQRMTAGTGVFHSEYNPSIKEPVHFLQIWIVPEKTGLTPSYEQKRLPVDEGAGKLRLIASRDGRDGSVTVHQDAAVYRAVLRAGESITHPLAAGRHAWIQVARGTAGLGDQALAAGDGAAVTGEPTIAITATGDAELLLFDLA